MAVLDLSDTVKGSGVANLVFNEELVQEYESDQKAYPIERLGDCETCLL